MLRQEIIVIIVCILLILFYRFIIYNEYLDNTQTNLQSAKLGSVANQSLTPSTTIQGLSNPYTGLFCYSDNDPIVSFTNGTFTANSYDGITPLYRDDYKIPSAFTVDTNYTGQPGQSPFIKRKINCNMIDIPHFYDPNKLDSNGVSIPDTKIGAQILPNDPILVNTLSKLQHVDQIKLKSNIIDNVTDLNNNHINGYLSSNGLRQLATNDINNENSRDIFNKLSKTGKQILCTYDNLNDINHWCYKTYQDYFKICNNTINTLGSGSGCSGFNTIKAFSTTKPVATLYSTSTESSGPSSSIISGCTMKCTRNPSTRTGNSNIICVNNCKKCGNTSC